MTDTHEAVWNDRNRRLHAATLRGGKPLISLQPEDWRTVMLSLERAAENDLSIQYSDRCRRIANEIGGQL